MGRPRRRVPQHVVVTRGGRVDEDEAWGESQDEGEREGGPLDEDEGEREGDLGLASKREFGRGLAMTLVNFAWRAHPQKYC